MPQNMIAESKNYNLFHGCGLFEQNNSTTTRDRMVCSNKIVMKCNKQWNENCQVKRVIVSQIFLLVI